MNTNIQKIRLSLSMSRKDFATALGVTVAAISNYEKGKRHPRLEISYRILNLAKIKGEKFNLEDIYAIT